MNLDRVVEPTFQAFPGQTAYNATALSGKGSLLQLLRRAESVERVNYGDLVKFANRPSVVGLSLSKRAQEGLVRFFSRGTNEYRAALQRRAAKPLGSVGYRGWQSSLVIDEKGQVSFAEGRQVPIKQLRTEFLKE